MDHLADQQLLRDYVEHRSETAFAELVRRHVDLVYSAALRMVVDGHLAKDVTQSTFVALAQNASALVDHPVLSGWLHRTTQNLAANTVRGEVRRRDREQEAVAMNELLPIAPDATWEDIVPHLDTALNELSEPDRDVVLLRYFEKKSAAEMAQILGITHDAAQKRVSRAVEKMREFFSKRKITLGASGLVVLISANAVQAAPSGLAATISATAMLTGTVASTSTVIATTKTIAMTTLQKTAVTTALIVFAGTGMFEAYQASQLREQNRTLHEQQASLAAQIQRLQVDNGSLSNRLTGMMAENVQSQSNSNKLELLKLRGQVARFQSEAADPAEMAAKAWFARVGKLKQRLEDRPEGKIPELQLLSDEDWLAAVKSRSLDSDNDYRRAESALRNTAEDHFANTLNAALQKYLQANNRQFPTDLSQLQGYFDSPVDSAILQRWGIMPGKTVPSIQVGDPMITEITAVDDLLDTRMAIGANGFGSTDFLGTEINDVMGSLSRAYFSATGGSFTDVSQLLPYATTPEQQAAVKKMIEQKAVRQ